MALAEAIWQETRTFPVEERFVLTQQLRRAVSSIPANIAEGFGRRSSGDYRRFLSIANGSLKEAETHVLLAKRVGLLSPEVADRMIEKTNRIGRLLLGLYRHLNR
jgi:four helix bundle protein